MGGLQPCAAPVWPAGCALYARVDHDSRARPLALLPIRIIQSERVASPSNRNCSFAAPLAGAMGVEGLNCVVTGGSGLVGRRLVEMLLERGARRVVSFDIAAAPADAVQDKRCVYVQGDLTDADDVRRACAGGVDCVWHIGALVGPYHDFDKYYEVNYKGKQGAAAQSALPAAAAAPVRSAQQTRGSRERTLQQRGAGRGRRRCTSHRAHTVHTRDAPRACRGGAVRPGRRAAPSRAAARAPSISHSLHCMPLIERARVRLSRLRCRAASGDQHSTNTASPPLASAPAIVCAPVILRRVHARPACSAIPRCSLAVGFHSSWPALGPPRLPASPALLACLAPLLRLLRLCRHSQCDRRLPP